MSMGICDACLEPAFHTRTEDGKRLLLDPKSIVPRFLLVSGELELHAAPQTKPKHPFMGAVLEGGVEMRRGMYAYKVLVYELHECPKKDDAPEPRVGEEIGV